MRKIKTLIAPLLTLFVNILLYHRTSEVKGFKFSLECFHNILASVKKWACNTDFKTKLFHATAGQVIVGFFILASDLSKHQEFQPFQNNILVSFKFLDVMLMWLLFRNAWPTLGIRICSDEYSNKGLGATPVRMTAKPKT